MNVLQTLLAVAALGGQAEPQEIAKKDLPPKALCNVCEAKGNHMGLEKPAAGMMYNGKAYYFCNASEVKEFKKDPDAFVPPVLPRPSPAFSLSDLAGTERSLESYKGKVALIDFWATWCKPCVAEMPDLQKLHDRLSGGSFTMIGVSIDESGAKAVKPFIQKRKFTYPILLDDKKVWNAFGVRNIPAKFLIDKNGQIVKQWVGKVDPKELEAAIEAAGK